MPDLIIHNDGQNSPLELVEEIERRLRGEMPRLSAVSTPAQEETA